MGRRVYIFLGLSLGALALLFGFQNATVVDFTAEQKKSERLSPIEKAIAKSEREQALRQRQSGVSNEQTQKKLRKKKRTPAAIGDGPFFKPVPVTAPPPAPAQAVSPTLAPQQRVSPQQQPGARVPATPPKVAPRAAPPPTSK